MLEVITGCMYSGKSSELIRRLRRHQIAGQEVLAVKPSMDDRYHATGIASHPTGGESLVLPAEVVRDVNEIRGLMRSRSWQVLGIDEIQFVSDEIIYVLEREANAGKRIIVAGLDLDSEGEPFGPMAELLAKADHVTKLTAVCVARKYERGQGEVCGKPATRSYRLPDRDTGEQVQVGSAGMYEARCRVCWARGRG